MTEHDANRLRLAAEKIGTSEREIIRLWCIRFPADPLSLAIAADRDALADLKAAISRKSRAADYAATGAGE